MNKGISRQVSRSMTHRSIIECMKSARWFMRVIALLQVSCFLFVFYSPGIQAAVETVEQNNVVQQVQGDTDEAKLSNALQIIKESVTETKDTVDARMLEEGGLMEDILAFFNLSSLQNESLDTLLGINEQVKTFNLKALENFAEVEAMLIAKGLPDEILQRHYDAVSKYEADYATLQAYIEICLVAGSLHEQQVAMDELNGFLQGQQFKRKQQEFDPESLPNKALQPDKTNKPKISRDEFIQSGLDSTPEIKLAALGDFKFDQLQDASNPAYLEESDEIGLTQPIRDKAAELQHDAVTIYHWVRNNIEWMPAWGAVQNAELTLGAERGNAMDIASLTIALLRASEIPARYVHGTIEVPKEQYLNWMGGFTSLDAAANYASSNGIPTTAIISAGAIGKIQMEHIWVEAATDFEPSRGAINRDADSWVQLDPSYKQYEFKGGVDTITISGIDIDQLAQNFFNTASVNETENWATGFDPSVLESTQQQLKSSLEDYATNNPTGPGIRDILGGRKTIILEYPALPSGLPNRIVTTGIRYDKLPGVLQQKISWGLGKDLFGSAIDPITFPFSKVNNEKITLSFRSATDEDQQILEALIPEGDFIDVSQLPNSIPSYLIQVIPELKLNGEIVKSGSPMLLGEEIDLVTGVKLVGSGRLGGVRSYSVIAGSYVAVNAYAQNISTSNISSKLGQLNQTEEVLESADTAQLSTLNREKLLGDMFHAGGISYYSQLLALSRIMGLQSEGHTTLTVGMGTIGYEPDVDSFFGIPRAIKTGGISFDIPFINASANSDGDTSKQVLFSHQIGLLSSSLEHGTPQEMFASEDPGQPRPDAISAVKAMQKASLAGQKLYMITRDNMDTVLPKIHHDSETMSEVRSSLNAGKNVFTHTDTVSVPGWSGAGYIILDPVTGSGAYKISGGNNGSFLKQVAEGLDKAIGWLSILEKTFNRPGPAIIIKKTITKIKKVVQNIKALIDIALKCNPGFALLGALLYLIQVYIVIKLSLAIMIATTALCATTGPLAGACAVAANVLVVWNAIDVLNESLKATADFILEGCSG